MSESSSEELRLWDFAPFTNERIFLNIQLFSNNDGQACCRLSKMHYSRKTMGRQFLGSPREWGWWFTVQVASRSRMSPQDHSRMDDLLNKFGKSYARPRDRVVASSRSRKSYPKSELGRKKKLATIGSYTSGFPLAIISVNTETS
ncbi:hypothetical protein Tco_0011334 [Tanacetum coccineum]